MPKHRRIARARLLGFALAALAWAGCGDDDPLSGDDNTPPALSVVQPSSEAVLPTSRPLFVVRIADSGSGVFVSTLNVQVDGRNVSQAFINGYDADEDESRVPGLIEFEDGLHTMTVRVADNAGNASTTTVTFTTLAGGGGPPPPPGGGN
jgi:hypothetical protein